MRLWHQKLIPYLDRQRLLGQHRECCALRGAGWGRPHSTVNYVFNYRPVNLIAYHYAIMDEMVQRGYNPDAIWRQTNWRGKILGADINPEWSCGPALTDFLMTNEATGCCYFPEHNNDYLKECIEILKEKQAPINFEEVEKLCLND